MNTAEELTSEMQPFHLNLKLLHALYSGSESHCYFANHQSTAYSQCVNHEVGVTGAVPDHPIVALISVGGKNT